eukprot:1138482-Pelagomonas_calceolata.AAC.4
MSMKTVQQPYFLARHPTPLTLKTAEGELVSESFLEPGSNSGLNRFKDKILLYRTLRCAHVVEFGADDCNIKIAANKRQMSA